MCKIQFQRKALLQTSSNSSSFQTSVCPSATFLEMNNPNYSSFSLRESLFHPLTITVPEAPRDKGGGGELILKDIANQIVRERQVRGYRGCAVPTQQSCSVKSQHPDSRARG